jgi:hypothetical protein
MLQKEARQLENGGTVCTRNAEMFRTIVIIKVSKSLFLELPDDKPDNPKNTNARGDRQTNDRTSANATTSAPARA